jgi:hypothetical protein
MLKGPEAGSPTTREAGPPCFATESEARGSSVTEEEEWSLKEGPPATKGKPQGPRTVPPIAGGKPSSNSEGSGRGSSADPGSRQEAHTKGDFLGRGTNPKVFFQGFENSSRPKTH